MLNISKRKELKVKSKVKPIDECSALLEIEASRETIEKAFDEVYDEIHKVAIIPGFRAGKAPKDMVKVNYAKATKEEVLKRLVPEGYKKALQEHGITPMGMPEISDLVFEENKPFKFKAKIETRPKFKLKAYKGLSLEKKKAVITDEDMNNTLKSLQEVNAKYTTPEDRPIKMGDYVVSDLECFVDGKAIHKKRENLWLTVEKDSFIPGLSDKLVGMKKGDVADIEARLPEKYPDVKLAGKDARYHLVAKEIKERKLPDIDDELAKDLGKASLEELKKEIGKELEARAISTAELNVENQLLAKIIDDNVFGVPASFVVRQLDRMVADAKRKLQERGFNKEELDKKDGEFKTKYKGDAERQIRLLFILDEIADKEKIEVNDEDLKSAYSMIASQSGKTEDVVKAYYIKEDLVDNLKDKIREGKTVKFLLDNSNITEK
ncbi:MAG: trigger factor [Candidatus Omnitrophica bacterium]|nr:trigger factor [Candidatus Omnitrophota bacterium]